MVQTGSVPADSALTVVVSEWVTPGDAAFGLPLEWDGAAGARYIGWMYSAAGVREAVVSQWNARHGHWHDLARLDLSGVDNALVAFDEWRMCATGWVMSGETYPAWEKLHGAARQWSDVDRAVLQGVHPLVGEMRMWLGELKFRDSDEIDLGAVAAADIVRAVERLYDGGVLGFERDYR